MQTALFITALALIAALVFLWTRLSRLQALLDTLNQDQRKLAVAWNALPPDARKLLPENKAMLSIEILNPVQLAVQESRYAEALGAVSPGLLRRIVHQRTAEILRSELIKHGVQAEVRMHGLA